MEHWAARGVRASIVRLPASVHGDGDAGLVPQLITAARKAGEAMFVGEGRNRWGGVHQRDAAVLFRLALEAGSAGARYHGVAEEGVPFRSIAEAVGYGLRVPVRTATLSQAKRRFSWFAPFVAVDNPASSITTQQTLGWRPIGPTLMADLKGDGYFAGQPQR